MLPRDVAAAEADDDVADRLAAIERKLAGLDDIAPGETPHGLMGERHRLLMRATIEASIAQQKLADIRKFAREAVRPGDVYVQYAHKLADARIRWIRFERSISPRQARPPRDRRSSRPDRGRLVRRARSPAGRESADCDLDDAAAWRFLRWLAVGRGSR